MFEKFKVVTDLIKKIQPDPVNNPTDSGSEDEDSFQEIESSKLSEIEKINNLAKEMALKDLSSLKNFTNVCHPDKLRSNISSLNRQQRRLFDDVRKEK